MTNESAYQFDANGVFTLRRYNRQKPFSSFLPGIAGLHGKPLWAFYVNRGQGIASFGVRDKNGSILEFQPAHKSYQTTPLTGFRTFLRVDGQFVEPFQAFLPEREAETELRVLPNALELEWKSQLHALRVKVSYFLLPNEGFGALVRQVELENLSDKSRCLELLDGLPQILPYGLRNADYKELGHTLRSWMDVYNREHGVPYYRLRASTADSVEVEEIQAGHFYLSMIGQDEGLKLAEPLVDAGAVFGRNDSLVQPDVFVQEGLEGVRSAPQSTSNKVPCGFTPFSGVLASGGKLTIHTLIGHTEDIERLNGRLEDFREPAYYARKRAEADALAQELTAAVATRTGDPIFDAYCRQSYLDNVLRGGEPIRLPAGDRTFVYHLYSRKHGDLERDYNFFSLQPGSYSQGNGNYRDANQNRRNDVFFHPSVEDFNLRMFMSLLQLDGYNPLVVKGCSFTVPPERLDAVKPLFEPSDWPAVRKLLQRPFAPGSLLAGLESIGIGMAHGEGQEALLEQVLTQAEQSYEADFGEGYWTDHWTYNLDLVDSYLAIYPDRLQELMFGSRSYLYYDSPAFVLPRSRKTVLVRDAEGQQVMVRQLGAVEESERKEAQLRARKEQATWVRTQHGEGPIYKADLFEKLSALALVKTLTLDPAGVGIEMEAGKPGWNDSLNGLPGLFASGFSELCELLRLVKLLIRVLEERMAGHESPLVLHWPVELAELPGAIRRGLEAYEADRLAEVGQEHEEGHKLELAREPGKTSRSERTTEQEQRPQREWVVAGADFRLWDRFAGLREQYRDRVFFGLDGRMAEVDAAELLGVLVRVALKLQLGMERALEWGEGVYPTYFTYEADAYEPLPETQGSSAQSAPGREPVVVKSFRVHRLPYFLEGPVRAMKHAASLEARRQLYSKVRETELYDRGLGMYKVNESLAGESFEIGRSRAFTPGWLENESVFMHMAYKYLLELLRGGLYEEFYQEARTALVPFMDPAVYGRSTTENVSFIASTANPDPAVHGGGFVARLSGSTAEFLSMWNRMLWGPQLYTVREGKLEARLEPILPGWLFGEDGLIQGRLLGSCEVTYENTLRRSTFGDDGVRVRSMLITYRNEQDTVPITGCCLPEPHARALREGRIASIRAVLQP